MFPLQAVEIGRSLQILVVKGKKRSVSFSITWEILLTLGTQEALEAALYLLVEERKVIFFLGLRTHVSILHYAITRGLSGLLLST